MTTSELERVEEAWSTLAPWLTVPRTEAEYQHLVSFLHSLVSRGAADETHPLASLLDVVGELIERYEDEHVPELV